MHHCSVPRTSMLAIRGPPATQHLVFLPLPDVAVTSPVTDGWSGPGVTRLRAMFGTVPPGLLCFQVHVCLQTGSPGPATVGGFLQRCGRRPVLKERGDHELRDAIQSNRDGEEVRHPAR